METLWLHDMRVFVLNCRLFRLETRVKYVRTEENYVFLTFSVVANSADDGLHSHSTIHIQ